jgi:hypothetical protein
VHVVLLTPLGAAERKTFAAALGVTNVAEFEEAIVRNGLEAFADRPRDVEELARYWRENGAFGSLMNMTESAVAQRLLEINDDRGDNRDLSQDQARRGAERLAAALTLAKSFTIAVASSADEPLAEGAVDPSKVLPEWNAAQVRALLRKAIFAPATYGRVRFHHRGSQEYLTASWLGRLISEGGRLREVERLIFVTRYDVDTLVSSLAPAAAWLALNYPSIRNLLIARDPPVLLRHGDPRSLPFEAKERLLENFAALHAAGDVANDSLDRTMLSMFASPQLAPAIRRAWAANERNDFHIDLLRIIREGVVADAIDLARSAVGNKGGDDYLRIVATQAIEATHDIEGYAELLDLVRSPAPLSARLAPHVALALFSDRLDVAGLFDLVRRTPQPRKGTIEGFDQSIEAFWAKCRTDTERLSFLGELAETCLTPPFVKDWLHISAAHKALARSVEKIAGDAIRRFGVSSPPELVSTLMIVERSDRSNLIDSEGPDLREQLGLLPDLKRDLFWADVAFARQHQKQQDEVIRHWQVYIHGSPLWSIELGDESWLMRDVLGQQLVDDRRIALSGLVSVLRQSDKPDEKRRALASHVDAHPELLADLELLTQPHPDNAEIQKHERRSAAYQLKEKRREQKNRASWISFAEELQKDNTSLKDTQRLAVWPGPWNLKLLTDWLRFRLEGQQVRHAATQWRLLEEGFSKAIAEAYRDGMKAMWRVTMPEPPEYVDGTGRNRKHTEVLACEGLALEAAEDVDWHRKLSDLEAARASQHACWNDEGIAHILDDLVESHLAIVRPIILETLQVEWAITTAHRAPLLEHFGYRTGIIPTWFIDLLVDQISTLSPGYPDRIPDALRCFEKVVLSASAKSVLGEAVRRLQVERGSDPSKVRETDILKLVFLADAKDGATQLKDMLDRYAATNDRITAMQMLVALFGDGFGRTGYAGILAELEVGTLEALLRSAYQCVRIEDDNKHDGSFTPDLRDNAERARGQILGALLSRSGVEAYSAMKRIALDQSFGGNTVRFLELTRSKAERDAEVEAWTASDVVKFEQRGISPAKTGIEFFEQVKGVLADIASGFNSQDASSAALLRLAKDEEQVQKWLGEQLTLRSAERYHVAREPIVANKKEPDITLSSTTSNFQLAIEIKHGGKKWSGSDYQVALLEQLNGQYLKPPNRRQGILVITHHEAKRTWRKTDDREILRFDELIAWLTGIAHQLGDDGRLVEVIGLDISSVS